MIRWLALLLLFGTVHAQIPKLDYSTYLGGSGDESAYAIATDAAGAVYIAGFTSSSDLPLVNSLQRYNAGGTGDLFVAKLKPDGSGFVYITYIGGSGGEGDLAGYVGGIAVDAQGNAYVAGVARSADFPTTPGAFQPTIGSKFVCDSDPNAGLCGDAFILKLSPTGDRLLYSTFLGGSDYDDAKAIAIDSAGAAYVTGMTASSDFPTTAGSFQTQLRDVDAYVAKLSPDGSQLVYSTLIAGDGFDAGMAIAVDGDGRAYVAGTTQAPDFPLKQALQTQFGEPWDAFVLRLNAAGSDLDFSTYLGGSGVEQAFGIALDRSVDIYIAGSTSSFDFPVKDAFQPFLAGDTNGFVTKLAGDGSSILYSTFLGGAGGASKLNAIAVDAAGNAYVTGQGGSDFPTVSSRESYSGGNDAVVAKLSPDGTRLLYSTFIGGSGADSANAIALDAFGRVVVAGQTSSPDFPVSATAAQQSLPGPSDAFVVRLMESAGAGPALSAPKAIPVGSTYVGQWSGSRTINVSNVGASQLAFSNIVPSSNVRVTSNCSTVLPGANCTISAQLLATSEGDQSGTITLYDNAPDLPQTIIVRAAGVIGGDLELASLVAGSSFSYYGRTAIPVTATVVNHGPYDATNIVVTISSSGGSANCDPCYVGTVKAGNSAVLRFNLLPAAYGRVPFTATVAADSTTPDLNPANNQLPSSVANPRYSVNPAQLSFADQPVSAASMAQRIVFTSLDQQPLALSASTNGDFAAVLWCEAGAFRCYADVTFQPAVAGSRAGVLSVSESVSGTTQPILLAGTGVLAPHAKLSDASVILVSGISSSSAAARAITLTNDGSAPLFLISIAVSGEFVQTNQCPVSLMPGESCSILISFVARSAGVSAGSLTICDNSPNRVEVIRLAGFGIPLAILVRPSRGPSTTDFSGSSPASTASIRPVRADLLRPSPNASARSTSSAKWLQSPSRPATRFGSRLSLFRSGTRDR